MESVNEQLTKKHDVRLHGNDLGDFREFRSLARPGVVADKSFFPFVPLLSGTTLAIANWKNTFVVMHV